MIFRLVFPFRIFLNDTVFYQRFKHGRTPLVETLNSVFIVNKAFEKLSKQKIPFTPEETEQILGQTASVLNKLNENFKFDHMELLFTEPKNSDGQTQKTVTEIKNIINHL